MRSSLDVERDLRQIAGAQWGVFAVRQAEERGISKRSVALRVANECAFGLYRGCYSLTRRVEQRGVWIAGVLSSGPGVVLSHMSALRLWGILTWTGPTEVLRVSGSAVRPRRDGNRESFDCPAVTVIGGPIPVLKIRSTRRLHESEVTTHQEIPVTSVARTFVDLAGSLGEGQMKKLLHEANRRELLRFDDMRAAIGRARGKKGMKRLRRIIEDWDPQTARTRNELEKMVLDLCRRHRLPMPIVNAMVSGYEVDFFWPEYGLIVETDGRRDHGSPHGFERDRERDSHLQLKGFLVLRLTWSMLIREPGRSAEKIREHLRLCGREGRRADEGWAAATLGNW